MVQPPGPRQTDRQAGVSLSRPSLPAQPLPLPASGAGQVHTVNKGCIPHISAVHHTAASSLPSMHQAEGSGCLQASGAGNGHIQLWAVRSHKAKQPSELESLGGLPALGFVNGLQIARSARFLVAGLGREPRLGRWGPSHGRNGLLIHALPLEE